jgi:hypothetical protein
MLESPLRPSRGADLSCSIRFALRCSRSSMLDLSLRLSALHAYFTLLSTRLATVLRTTDGISTAFASIEGSSSRRLRKSITVRSPGASVGATLRVHNLQLGEFVDRRLRAIRARS